MEIFLTITVGVFFGSVLATGLIPNQYRKVDKKVVDMMCLMNASISIISASVFVTAVLWGIFNMIGEFFFG